MEFIDEGRLRSLEAIAAKRAAEADPGHDILHVRRVARNAKRIAESEGSEGSIAVAAALLHELFNYPKDHPDKAKSGEVCAEMAAQVLRSEGVSEAQAAAVAYAIRVHPYSLGIIPKTIEARILQDADRLDALGAVGIARVFSTGSALGRPFYAEDDPFCALRDPDDGTFTVDHFYRKLLKLPATMHTEAGRRIGAERAAYLEGFLAQLEEEVSQTSPSSGSRR